MVEEKKETKILFYTCTARAFRTTLIGHLYEIANNFPVILLSEKLDEETDRIIRDKTLFPKIEKIIQVDVINNSKIGLFSKKSRDFYKLTKKVFKEERPDVLITSSDTHSLFEVYLNRLGKKYGAVNIAMQAFFQISNIKKVSEWFDLCNAYMRFSPKLPLSFRLFLINIRKNIGHFLYHYIFPLTIGEWPFVGKSSYVLKTGNSGMRDANYQVVFSKRDYDFWVRDGVSQKKLFIQPHPLETKTRDFLKTLFDNKLEELSTKKSILLVLPDIEIGFRENDFLLIPKEERIKEWVEISNSVSKIFPEHNILLKPHPNSGPFLKDLDSLLSELKNDKIRIVDGKNPVDEYIQASEIIIGLPTSISTVLYTAHLQCPEKRIISINFDEELLGNNYKGIEGIDYADSMQRFLEILDGIKQSNLDNKNVEDKRIEKENEIVSFIKKVQNEKQSKKTF